MLEKKATKSLALTMGILCLVFGILSLLTGWFMWIVWYLIFPIRLTLMGLAIWALVYYKDDSRMSNAPSILAIVGNAIFCVLIGLPGDVLTIIAGGLYLSGMSAFNEGGLPTVSISAPSVIISPSYVETPNVLPNSASASSHASSGQPLPSSSPSEPPLSL